MVPRLPARRRVLIPVSLLAAFGLLLASALTALANVPILQISTDPYTNTSSQHQTEVEPDTFSYGSTIVAAFQVGRFYDGGSSNIGWATSTDGGATWTHGFLPGTTTYATPPGPAGRISDPSVSYDAAHGVWMIQTIPITAGGSVFGIWVSRSTDGGLTWGNPVTVRSQGGLDKNWQVCDNAPISPYFGYCYGEWDNNGGGNIMQMSRSTDGGLTWSAPATPAGSPSGLGGQPVVLPTGRVVVPFSENYSAIGSFVSTDGGVSWSAAVTVSSSDYHAPAGPMRSYPMPSAEVDPQGRVYAVWQDCRFRSGCPANDIVMSTSTDGLTWSAVTRIPIDPTTSTVDHFIPGIGVDMSRTMPPAHLALAYYYFPIANCGGSCQLMVGFVSSLDGGATWSAATQVAGPMAPTWLPSTNQGYMVGDYISTSISTDLKAHPVFAVANAPGAQFDEAMYTPNPGLVLRGGAKPAFSTPPPAGPTFPGLMPPSRGPAGLFPSAH